MTYEEAIASVAALESRGWRLGLDRMEELCRTAGLNDALGGGSGPSFLHVAGTNGKGSTTAFLQSLLVEAGFKTGAFFSPFVLDYRERIQVNRDMISPQRLAEVVEALLPCGEALANTEFGGATKFELETAMGFLFWKQEKCEWVALEVGLGGRLDATNVVHPAATTIVSIGLDHVSILGDTLAKIASEKAGILKAGIPAVVGQVPVEAMDAIESQAKEVGAPLWKFGKDILLELGASGYTVTTPTNRYSVLRPRLKGAMQPHNMALALATMNAAGISPSKEVAQRGVSSAFAPGRFQLMEWNGCPVLLDGAHNREAAIELYKTLIETYPQKRFQLVTNMLSGHDPALFYTEISGIVASTAVAPIDFIRAIPPEETAKSLRESGMECEIFPDVKAALHSACEKRGASEMVLVTGSNYLVGEAMALISGT